MKNTFLLLILIISFNTNAQFIEEKPPTEKELQLNNANETAELIKLASLARIDKNHKNLLAAMEKLVALNPHVPILQYQLAEAYSLNVHRTSAYNTLIKLQKQGLYFDVDINPNFANIQDFPVFKYIKENFDANGEHYGKGTESFNIDKSFSGLLFESLAFDYNSQSFLMGSLRDGRIISIANDGEITELVAAAKGGLNGPWASIDLAIDEKNDTLWVASSAISQFGKITKESSGSSGVFKYKLSTGELQKSYLFPKIKNPSFISSMHLTDQGDLYFVGNINSVVLKIAQGADQMSVVFTSDKFTNMRNITTDETGKIIYVSDAKEGIVVVESTSGKYFVIENSDNLNLTGITDLIYDDNGLIFIQSGIKPERVMRLKLKKNKAQLDKIIPIESSHPLFNTVSYGAVIGNDLFYIANSQLSKTNVYGGLIKGYEWDNMYIIKSETHFNEQSSLDYQKQIDAYEKNKKGEK